VLYIKPTTPKQRLKLVTELTISVGCIWLNLIPENNIEKSAWLCVKKYYASVSEIEKHLTEMMERIFYFKNYFWEFVPFSNIHPYIFYT
jgi:hypothetical protein